MPPHRGTLARRKMMRRTAMAATIHRRVVAICVVLGLIFAAALVRASVPEQDVPAQLKPAEGRALVAEAHAKGFRSEEHTSELQSHLNLVCRLLLEKKKKKR